MTLPIKPPYPPMEALLVNEIPAGDNWEYEPKWDGFRCLAFRDGKTVELQSKSGQPLERYFPEVVEALLKLKASKFVIDGELVIPVKDGLSFDDLLQRIHPAASRVAKLSRETPAHFIVFDLLVDDAGKAIAELPLTKRREKLESFAKKYLAKNPGIELSPKTKNIAIARKWLSSSGVKLDGVIAKRLDLPYRSGERDGMQKVKRMRTADCVVGGFRYASKGKVVGSLLLGLYDDSGLLQHVGYTSSFNEAQKKELTKKLEALIEPPGFTGKAPGGPSRWSTKKTSEWEPLVTRLVAEVQYDHFTGGRFRHGTKFLRWRPDKKPKQCSLDQISRK
ncbi:MAG TPA: ATP-dependent DNA ligase [Blastocatellia bacterium]|jgi:ATP-dependent DNA ligase|nr:ATP-dependent DNA ligase [Blastocatellia bacterium]HAF24839.1 ATP-dependent DNA ligase [Blastocatellia bacterium]